MDEKDSVLFMISVRKILISEAKKEKLTLKSPFNIRENFDIQYPNFSLNMSVMIEYSSILANLKESPIPRKYNDDD